MISFQRASGLVADGVAGPTTMKAMDEQSLSRLRLDDVGHQDHQLLVQARSHISDIDKGLGRTADQFTDNIAGALTVQARADGLHRIYQVALSPDGTKLWGVQIPPGRTNHLFDLRTHVPTPEANTSIEQSSAKWPEAMQQFQHHEQSRAMEQQQIRGQQQGMTGPATTSSL